MYVFLNMCLIISVFVFIIYYYLLLYVYYDGVHVFILVFHDDPGIPALALFFPNDLDHVLCFGQMDISTMVERLVRGCTLGLTSWKSFP